MFSRILKLLRLFIIAFCIGLIAFSVYKIILSSVLSIENKRDNDEYADIYSQIKVSSSHTPSIPTIATDGHDAALAPTLEEIIENNRLLMKEYIDINEDFSGYLYFPNQDDMRWPFVYPADNEYYLSYNFKKTYNKNGTVFADALAKQFGLNKNNVLYAHHMRDGQMFGTLLRYKNNPKFYNNNPYIITDALTGYDVWVIFSVYVTEPNYGYVQWAFDDDLEFMDLIEDLTSRSMLLTNIDVLSEDVLLTLSTCDYDFADARFVVHARKLRPGESVTPKATLNPTH